MSIQSYTLNFELTFNDQGVLKTNKVTVDGYVFTSTQSQFVQLAFEDIFTFLQTVESLTRLANKHAINSYLFERVGVKDFHCRIGYHNGTFDIICDSNGIVSVAALPLAKELEERTEQFRIIQNLIGVMEKSPLVKISMVRV